MKRNYKPRTQRGTDARQSAQKANWRVFQIKGACQNLQKICLELGLKEQHFNVGALEHLLVDEAKAQYNLSK